MGSIKDDQLPVRQSSTSMSTYTEALPENEPNFGLIRAMTALSELFASVRPASYSDAACSDWIRAAVKFCQDIPIDVLEEAAFEAAKVCHRPANIVALVHEKAAEILAARERARQRNTPLQLAEGWQHRAVPGDWWHDATQEEMNEIHRQVQAALERERVA